MRVRIGPYRKNRAEKIEIEKFDTWSMDATLALIIHPMLIQLKETTHGAPVVSLEDVPEHLHATEESIAKYLESGERLSAYQDRISNGFRLFGKYYENLWD